VFHFLISELSLSEGEDVLMLN